MIIDSFYLTTPSLEDIEQTTLCPYLNMIDIEINSSSFVNLQNAVSWALDNEEDAILLIKKDFKSSSFDFENIVRTLLDLYEHDVNIFGIGSSIKKNYIPVTDILYATDRWEHESAWILLRPIFPIILNLDINLIEKQLNKLVTIADILNIVGHTKFTFSNITPLPFFFEESRINIIIPFRNAEKFIVKCISSITKQQYKNYRIFFIDDCSEDNSFDHIPETLNFFKTRNITRKYALENIINTLMYNDFNDSDIICLVDGDDKLSHPFVFKILNQIYSSENVQITYGQFRLEDGFNAIGAAYSEKDFENIRRAAWQASHLKTFRYSLFRDYLTLDPEILHMKDSNGKVFKMPYDMAIMFPLLEIAGYNNSRFINLPLYIYSRHENNDDVQNSELQINGELEIRNKKSLTR